MRVTPKDKKERYKFRMKKMTQKMQQVYAKNEI